MITGKNTVGTGNIVFHCLLSCSQMFVQRHQRTSRLCARESRDSRRVAYRSATRVLCFIGLCPTAGCKAEVLYGPNLIKYSMHLQQEYIVQVQEMKTYLSLRVIQQNTCDIWINYHQQSLFCMQIFLQGVKVTEASQSMDQLLKVQICTSHRHVQWYSENIRCKGAY